ncbi:MAG: hypothetical protein AAFS10_18840 [Myxococcota bacterium]
MNTPQTFVHAWMVLAVALCVVACSSPGTSEGALGSPVDLSKHLPEDADPKAKVTPYTTTVKVGKKATAEVELHWEAVALPKGNYIRAVKAKVTKSAPGVQITAPVVSPPINTGTLEKPNMKVDTQFSWSQGTTFATHSGSVLVSLGADGKHAQH